MLVGYVSDENYLALHGVAVEFSRDGEVVAQATSSASGAVVCDVEAGDYRLTLARDGYGAKRVDVTISAGRPLRLRMLSDRPYGFMWPKWTVGGGESELRVHCTEPFRAELFRYGLDRQPAGLLGWFDEHGPKAMTQILPDTDVTQTGVRWNSVGYTSPGHVRRVTAPPRSGLYYVHVTTASGRFTSFPWVVAPAAPTAPVAVVAATNNWNAYNRFGGRSNYINEDGLPPTPTVNARQDLRRYVHGNHTSQSAPNDAYPPLSFERPEPECEVGEHERVTDPMTGRLASTLAPGLWRLLAWLEREGVDYDVYSDHQLHTGVLDLDAYRVLVLDMHPEYWSRRAFERVVSWVEERGGRLMYLGGNGIDCEVEYVGSDAARYLTHQPDRGSPAEAHLESRFHSTVGPQAALLGVTFTHTGEGTAAPYAVERPGHWAFEGTGLRAGDLFGTESLHERVPGGASGHETDKRTASTPPGTVLLARGRNPDGGGAEMVYRETAGGGAVFSTGSITYIASLLVDPPTSRLTANVLHRLAADPAGGPAGELAGGPADGPVDGRSVP